MGFGVGGADAHADRPLGLAGALCHVLRVGAPPCLEELAGIAVKAIPWSFFVGSMGFATASLVGNANLMTKIYFPREMLPLAATLAQSFDSTIGTVALLIVCPLVGVHFGLGLFWAPLLAACVFLFTAGAALLAGCANLFLRDVKYLVQVLLTFGIFFTPVFFEPYMFGRLGARVMMLNPLAPLLEGLRLSVVYNHQLLDTMVVTTARGPVVAWSPWYLAYSVTCAVVIFFVGLLVFHRAENKFAEGTYEVRVRCLRDVSSSNTCGRNSAAGSCTTACETCCLQWRRASSRAGPPKRWRRASSGRCRM